MLKYIGGGGHLTVQANRRINTLHPALPSHKLVNQPGAFRNHVGNGNVNKQCLDWVPLTLTWLAPRKEALHLQAAKWVADRARSAGQYSIGECSISVCRMFSVGRYMSTPQYCM